MRFQILPIFELNLSLAKTSFPSLPAQHDVSTVVIETSTSTTEALYVMGDFLIGSISFWVFVSYFVTANLQYIPKLIPARVVKGRMHPIDFRSFGLK